MDPTDIVLVPYDLHRLTVYVGTVSVLSLIYLLLTTPRPKKNALIMTFLVVLWHFVRAIVMTWMVVILCGAPPRREIQHTILACVYVATLVFFTTTINSSSSSSSNQQGSPTTWWWWHSRLNLPNLPMNLHKDDDGDGIHDATTGHDNVQQSLLEDEEEFYRELLAVCQSHATVFVSIPLAVLRLYDWGSQIQRWPLPLLLGSTYGHVVGTVLGILMCLILCSSPRAQYWYQQQQAIAMKQQQQSAVYSQHED
jgi:hypothetical protein